MAVFHGFSKACDLELCEQALEPDSSTIARISASDQRTIDATTPLSRADFGGETAGTLDSSHIGRKVRLHLTFSFVKMRTGMRGVIPRAPTDHFLRGEERADGKIA